jgi:hypothetical protein
MSMARNTMCKSNVIVNHLHLQVQIFNAYIYPIAVYIYIFFILFYFFYFYFFLILTQGQCKYLSNTLTWPHVNVLGHVIVSVSTKIYKVTLSLGLISPQTFLLGVSIK